MGVESHAKGTTPRNGCGDRGDVCLRQVYDEFVITLEFENTGRYLIVARAAKNGSANMQQNEDEDVDVLVHGITRWAPGTMESKHA